MNAHVGSKCQELKEVEIRVRDLEISLNNVPETVRIHDERLRGLEIFKAQVFAWAAAGSILGGLASSLFQRYIITH